MTDDSSEEAMDTPFLITASELRDRQTMRRRKRHLSTKSEAICRLVAGAEGEGEMKTRIIQPWTPSDDERLRKLAAEGRSSVTIAERMKRSSKSIRSRARALKTVLRRANALEAAKTFARDKER